MQNNSALMQNQDFYNNNSSVRILPFLNRNRPSTSYTNRSTGIIERINRYNTKESIESLIYEILINENLIESETGINPFGAIYLCDLQPDNINYSYIEKIKNFNNINDVSDSIYINDGMDD